MSAGVRGGEARRKGSGAARGSEGNARSVPRDRLPEGLEDPQGDGTRRAFADPPVVDVHDGDELRARAREEALVRIEEVKSRDALLPRGDSQARRHLQDRATRDPLERAVPEGRREQRAALHDENVVGGAFRHEAVVVQHDRLEGAGAVGLDLREDVLQVVEALDPRVEDRRPDLASGRRDHPEPLLVQILGVELHLVHDADHRRALAVGRVEAELAHAPRHHEADVRVPPPVAPDRFDHHAGHRVDRHRDLERDGVRRFIQTVEVLAETKDATVVDADPLEHAVAVEEAVIEDRDLRLVAIVECAVDVDMHADPG